MKERCLRPSHESYHRYGGRGITVCERWLKFENFLSDMGKRPSGMELDRKNNDGNYEPGNCRWRTCKQNNRNKSTNVRYTALGETLTQVEWSEKTGIKSNTIRQRIKAGWSPERALTVIPCRGIE